MIVAANDFHNAAKSALVFAGKLHHFSDLEPAVRIVRSGEHLVFITGDAYMVAFIRIAAEGSDELDVTITAADLKNSLPNIKAPIRDKVSAKVWEIEQGLILQRSDDAPPLGFARVAGIPDEMYQTWAMPTPYDPIDYRTGSIAEQASRVALSSSFFARFKQATWDDKKDALVFEPGAIPTQPVTVRVGDYLLAKVMPRHSGGDANLPETRDSWANLLSDIGMQQ
jgi:hypothetical protein